MLFMGICLSLFDLFGIGRVVLVTGVGGFTIGIVIFPNVAFEVPKVGAKFVAILSLWGTERCGSAEEQHCRQSSAL